MSESAILEPPSFSISTERARYLAQKSVAKRAENSAKRAKELAQARSTPADYVLARLQRVRAQLERIDAMIEVEEDAQKIDRLVSASTRLSEQVRILSGIPLPGSRRPGRETKGRVDAGPVEPL